MDKFAKSLLQAGNTTIPNILLKNYPKLGMNSDQLVLYLQIKRCIDVGSYFPDIHELTDTTGLSSTKIYQILHELIQNKLMKIKTLTDKRGQSFDVYDFSLMYDKLSELNQNNDEETFSKNDLSTETKESDRKETFNKIESEFGRPLSPIEIETINQWINDDHYDPKMIQLALRESVLNQVYSLKYIDRILVNWEKSNIKTPNDVEKNRVDRENRRQKNTPNNKESINRPEIPIFKIDK